MRTCAAASSPNSHIQRTENATTPSERSRRALITGGASGFGLATAQALLDKGAQVAIADLNRDKLDEAERILDSERLRAVPLDVTSASSVRAAVAACENAFGGLDTLVNCAGILAFSKFVETSEEEWDRIIDVDLKGTFLCCQAAAPLLCASGRGRIVNIGSDASKLGWPLITAYVAAKFGVVGLTKSIAGELAEHDVTVNCVCPIGVPTTGMGEFSVGWKSEATGLTGAQVRAATARDVPLKRNCSVEDVVNAILFFLAEESNFLTAVALDVDGGMTSTATVPGVG